MVHTVDPVTAVSSQEPHESQETVLPPSIRSAKVSTAVIHHALLAELANRRHGSANTLRRSDVRGSNRKPWRQKGTGRARAGVRRSPLWRGGGIIFGPHPRDYAVRFPRKQRHVALRALLSLKEQAGAVAVRDSIEIETPTSKALVAALINEKSSKTLVILGTKDAAAAIKRAALNIPWLIVESHNRISLHHLYHASSIVFTRDAMDSLGALLHHNPSRRASNDSTRAGER